MSFIVINEEFRIATGENAKHKAKFQIICIIIVAIGIGQKQKFESNCKGLLF